MNRGVVKSLEGNHLSQDCFVLVEDCIRLNKQQDSSSLQTSNTPNIGRSDEFGCELHLKSSLSVQTDESVLPVVADKKTYHNTKKIRTF
jgi:hypothetical protein